MNRYVSKDQNSNPAYPQYPMSRQTPFSSAVHSQNYQMSMKANCNNNMYYSNANPTKNYATNNVVHSPKKYGNSNLGLPQVQPTVPQSPQIIRNTGTPIPQMPQYGDHTNYSMQNAYTSNYNAHTNSETEQSYNMLQPTIASPTTALSSQENLIHSASLVTSNQVSQMSSIPTPPETSSLPSDGLSIVDNTPHNSSSDTIKMNSSFGRTFFNLFSDAYFFFKVLLSCFRINVFIGTNALIFNECLLIFVIFMNLLVITIRIDLFYYIIEFEKIAILSLL